MMGTTKDECTMKAINTDFSPRAVDVVADEADDADDDEEVEEKDDDDDDNCDYDNVCIHNPDDPVTNGVEDSSFLEHEDVSTQSSSNHNPSIDGGYAWVIVIAVFLLHFLLIGFLKSGGVFFVEVQRRFESNAAMTSLVIGLGEGIFSIAALFVLGILIHRLTVRQMCMFGSFILAAGITMTAFCDRIEYLVLTYSLCFGLSKGFIMGPSFHIINGYFVKRRALATTIATTGASCGGIVIPLLARHFFDNYAFPGGVALTGGFLLHSVIGSALLIPLSQQYSIQRNNKRSADTVLLKQPKQESLRSDSFDNGYITQGNDLNNKHYPQTVHAGSTVTDTSWPTKITSSLQSILESKLFHSTSTLNNTIADIIAVDKENENTLPSENDSNDPENNNSINDDNSNNNNNNNNNKNNGNNERISTLRKLFLFLCQNPLLRSASFWLLVPFYMAASVGVGLSQIYLIPLAKERGLTDDQGAFCLSVLNMLDIVSHLIPGIILNHTSLSSTTVVILPTVAIGIIGCLTPFFHSYESFLCMSVIYGLFVGFFWALQSLFAIDTLGIHNYSSSMGFYYFTMGVAMAASFPIAGALKDFSGTYSTTFFYLASMQFLSVAILLVLPLVKRYDVRRGILKL